MILALAQLNPLIGDIKGNKEKILSNYRRGVEEGADLVIFPELSLIGYSPLDLVEKKEFREAAIEAAEELAAATGSVGLVFGGISEIIDDVGTNVFNSAFLCFDGKIQFIQRKTLIPNYDVFDEMRYFESSPEVEIFEFQGEKLGISVCEDIWNDRDFWKQRLYPNDPVEQQIKLGATLLINISASPYAYGKAVGRTQMLSTLTRQDSIRLAYCCCVGAQTDLIFDGASLCFNEYGEVVRMGKAYAEDFFLFDTNATYPPIEQVEDEFEVEVYRSLVFGLRDYVKKNRFSEVMFGLSGGIDSALVACIAAEAVGPDKVHAVMLPSAISSAGSVDDSVKLIENLGIKHAKIEIQPVVDQVNETLAPFFEGMPVDITEENLQARSRGLLLMGLSNKFNRLLLATGNKSEFAVGYATLYGDMNGGLSVIGDVYKTDVYRLARYINRNREIIPEEIIAKPPSAELRPDQTDQDSLPPYDELDDILRMYLEENKEVKEISAATGKPDTVKQVLRLVDMNEFKRKQAAPILRVSNKAFGYGRRFPIVQGWRK